MTSGQKPTGPKNLISGLLRLLMLFLLLHTFYGCQKESEKIDPNPGQGLRFSADTIYFDTVFTGLKTVTIRVRVYNPNDKAVRIKTVSVQGVEGLKPFSFIINGRTGPYKVENVDLEGKDSAYVLVSGQINPKNQDLPFVVKDSLVFELEGRSQKQDVKILAYGQDALYLRNTSISSNTTWTSSRPIILLDTVSIRRGSTLTITPGTRIYGYNSAFLIVRGNLEVEGSLEKPVIFEGTRRENYYSDVPGQWGGILLMDGSFTQMSRTVVRNAFRGIQVGEVGPFPQGILAPAVLLVHHTLIHNMVDYGILGVKGVASVLNCQFADCGESGFSGLQGGSYELWHNTFGLSGNNPFRREGKYQLTFSDNLPDSRTQTTYVGDLTIKAVNNVIYGSEEDEIAFGQRVNGAGTKIDTIFFHNLIRSRQAYYFRNTGRTKGNQSISNSFRFIAPFKYDLATDTLGESSWFGSGLALDTITSLHPFLLDGENIRSILSQDLLGKTRKTDPGQHPDAGAYIKRNQKN